MGKVIVTLDLMNRSGLGLQDAHQAAVLVRAWLKSLDAPHTVSAKDDAVIVETNDTDNADQIIAFSLIAARLAWSQAKGDGLSEGVASQMLRGMELEDYARTLLSRDLNNMPSAKDEFRNG